MGRQLLIICVNTLQIELEGKSPHLHLTSLVRDPFVRTFGNGLSRRNVRSIVWELVVLMCGYQFFFPFSRVFLCSLFFKMWHHATNLYFSIDRYVVIRRLIDQYCPSRTARFLRHPTIVSSDTFFSRSVRSMFHDIYFLDVVMRKFRRHEIRMDIKSYEEDWSFVSFLFSTPTCQHKKTLTLIETCGSDQRSTVVETCTEQFTNSRNMKILDFLIIDVLLFSHCIMDISLTVHIYTVWWTTRTIWSVWSDNYSWESHRVIDTRLRHERRSPDLSRICGPVKKSYGNSA